MVIRIKLFIHKLCQTENSGYIIVPKQQAVPIFIWHARLVDEQINWAWVGLKKLPLWQLWSSTPKAPRGAFHETCHHWQFVIHWQVTFLILIGYETLSLTVAMVIVSEWQIVSDDKFHEMPPKVSVFKAL